MPTIAFQSSLRSCAAIFLGGLSLWLVQGSAAQTTSAPASARPALEDAQGGLEAPLIRGNLGKSGEVTNLQGEAVRSGLAGQTGPGLTGLGGRPGATQGGAVGSGAQDGPQSDVLALPPLAGTQFQRFVQQATGKTLPLFGYNLFDRKGFRTITDAPVPASYVVGPGDELDLRIWGGMDISIRLPVDRQGQITVPRVGPVTVAGVKSEDLDAFLKKQLSRVYANFELSATVGKLRTIQVYVVGQARAPGSHTVSSLATLMSAVFETGGPSATGSMRHIELVRQGKRVAQLDLYKFIQTGAVSSDVRLLPGDVIAVPPVGPRVAVTGALDNPGIFELASAEESVEQVLGYSGSSTTLTTPHKALVERVDKLKARAPREVQERLLDAAGLKSSLRDGDVLTLFAISSAFENAVTLRGSVAAPLRYAYKPGMKVSDLIPEADALIVGDYYQRKNILVQYESGRNISAERDLRDALGALPEINWDYASIARLDKGAVKTRLIPFNLGRAVRDLDPQHNLVLEPGDVVTVFSIRDIPVPLEKRTQFVKLAGEVKVPGIYEIKPGETLPDLINRAGGFAQNAHLYGTVFTRETTRVQQQANLDAAIRRMEAQLTSQVNTGLQNVVSTEGNQNLQAQLAAQRMTLERLRSLRATGRIALELDPAQRPRLPRLTLEDGDVIEIPAQPSFVAVFGAVFTENSFVHRDGMTVGDLIQRAGVMRDADVAGAMLIRADGTVRSSQAQHSLFGFGQSSFMGTKVYPGDSVFVPERLDKRTAYSQFISGAKDLTQVFFQFGLGTAAIRSLRN